MIGWDDIYKVVAAMVPLYVPLILGYLSIKWWHMFTPEHCDAINKFSCFFIVPFFSFEFVSHINPFKLNCLFIGADVISKVIILVVLALWANFTPKGSYSWSITSFSLSTLNNTLVVGVPLMKAMYGKIGEDLVIQSFALQSILWFMLLLIMLDFRQTRTDFVCDEGVVKDLEGNDESNVAEMKKKPSFWYLMMIVGKRMAKNPNCYACILGIAWAFCACRWHFKMPSILEGSILIMSRAGSGIAMFCMGLFMALQKKIISCGVRLTIFGMILRFIAGPASMAIGSIAVGLRGDVLRIVIIQAALPQAITGFIFAKEYGLHANVLSTAVIFGTIVSLPLLIGYYVVLELIH